MVSLSHVVKTVGSKLLLCGSLRAANSGKICSSMYALFDRERALADEMLSYPDSLSSADEDELSLLRVVPSSVTASGLLVIAAIAFKTILSERVSSGSNFGCQQLRGCSCVAIVRIACAC